MSDRVVNKKKGRGKGPQLTHAELLLRYKYDADSGEFSRAIPYGALSPAGTKVGRVAANGYVVFSVCGKQLYAHRLAWFYTYGVWPKKQIDHINGVPTDNRLANLRDVCEMINRQNLRKAKANSKIGLLGVCRTASGRFVARIRTSDGGVKRKLFRTAQEAADAYVGMKREFHAGCTI